VLVRLVAGADVVNADALTRGHGKVGDGGSHGDDGRDDMEETIGLSPC
jgi:hypothetical protein